MGRVIRASVLAAFAISSSAAFAGPEWIEGSIGPAGNLPATAQPTTGSGHLVRISGGLASSNPGLGQSSNFEDMFIVNITDPANFSATTVGPNGHTDFDSQLWLFTIDGHGVLGNNDTLEDLGNADACRNDINKDLTVNCHDLLAVIDAWGSCQCCPADTNADHQVNVPDLLQVIGNWGPIRGSCQTPGSTIGAMATDAMQQTIPGPGLYMIAVSSAGSVPRSANGPIFSFGINPGEVSSPDGPGGAGVLTGWQAVECHEPKLGDYSIYVGGGPGGGAVGMSGLFLDIKPESCPNSHNPNSNGVLPVTICGTGGFDVHQINLSSLVIAREDGIGGTVPVLSNMEFEDEAIPFTGPLCECCHDDDDYSGGKECPEKDGYDDLNIKFSSSAMRTVLLLNQVPGGSYVVLEVRGETTSRLPVVAKDCIRIVPPHDEKDER